MDEGQKLRITTTVKDNPIPEFPQCKDGKAMDNSRAHVFCNGELIGVEMVKANLQDSGKYECHLSNEDRTCHGICKAEVRKVYSAPLFSKEVNNAKQVLKCDAEFIANIDSNTKPEIK